MRTVDLIQKKRDGVELNAEEIEFIIRGYIQEEIPDYQISAWAMAVFFKGMTPEETANLTMAMVRSGETIDLSEIHGIKVDKHSTGGVGDKTSLIVVPLVASLGVSVAKMSGRGLGHTGGTVDKLESIQGFRIELSRDEFIHHVNNHKMALVGQSGNLVPADKKLYALRDVTGTVNSIPLIASSIMSKKIASGADAIILDVKVGSGAFMKSIEEAAKLAEAMVEIGKHVNRKTIAVITNMDEPLGYEVGNANEVREAIEVLHGKGETKLTEICLTLAAQMTFAAGKYESIEAAYKAVHNKLHSGEALETFKQFVEAQGGDPNQITDPAKLPQAQYHTDVIADNEGYVQRIATESIGQAAMMLGAGRRTKDESVDHAAGITLKKKVGDWAAKGDVLAAIHSNKTDNMSSSELIKKAYQVGSEKVEEIPTVYKVIE